MSEKKCNDCGQTKSLYRQTGMCRACFEKDRKLRIRLGEPSYQNDANWKEFLKRMVHG